MHDSTHREVNQHNKLLNSGFLEQAKKKPNALAIISSGKCITYQELLSRSLQLSEQLVSLGAKPNKLVAIVMEKGWEQVVSVLGILEAGAAYLPIDPSESKERLQQLLTQGEVEIIVTQRLYKDSQKFPKELHQLIIESDSIQYTSKNLNKQKQTPRDLAYVIFTSGSTGLPKGVMIEHHSALNTIIDINQRFKVTSNDKIFALSALNFDLSVYDIFGALVSGATIIVPNAWEEKEPAHWLEIIQREKITIWNSVPALMHMLVDHINGYPELLENNEAFSALRFVLLSGDWIPVNLPEKIQTIFKNAQVISLGGATEASIWSILYPINKVESTWKSIPYGKAMLNQEFHILDDKLEPVKDNKPGQLFIGGVGLARGYWRDEKRTNNSFINHCIYGCLYKTGDLGRYLPDGNIEFLGRIEYQVVIRGFRVEPSAIESALLEHPCVSQAIVVANKNDFGNTSLIAYFTSNKFKQYSAEQKKLEQLLSEQQISHWQEVYNTVDKITCNQDPYFNISGWISSYTGKPFPREQMQEWVDNTVKRIFELNPKSVLEIGCGTGLLLFRIAPNVDYYCGTDFSETALSYILSQQTDKITKRLSLQHRPADHFKTEDKNAYDAVILNSVIQYFPSVDYLCKVLDGAVSAVSPGGKIFIGDIRSFEHLEAFHCAVQLYRAGDGTTYSQWKGRVHRSIIEDGELLVSPKFFLAFAKYNSRITHIDIQLKRGSFKNEMNCFRYDVVLHIEAELEKFPAAECIDWQQNPLKFASICQKLIKENPPALSILNIPNARLAGIDKVMGFEENDKTDVTLKELHDYLHQAQKNAIDPETLYDLSDELAYNAHITWSQEFPINCFNVTFYKQELSSKPLIEVKPAKHNTDINFHKFTNMPLKGRYVRQLVHELKIYIKERLPEYMNPTHFVYVDYFPVTNNGKINRQALPPPVDNKKNTVLSLPKSRLQQVLTSLWTKVLKIEDIGLNDHFINDLGGTSLQAVQLAVEIRKILSVEIDIQDLLYSTPTVFSLSKLIKAKQKINTKAPQEKPLANSRHIKVPEAV